MLEMGGKTEAGIGARDGLVLEAHIFYGDGLETWRDIGLGLVMKVRIGVRLECGGGGDWLS